VTDLPARLTLEQAADLLGTDLVRVRQLVATGRVEVHQVCSGRCETLIGRDSVLALSTDLEVPCPPPA